MSNIIVAAVGVIFWDWVFGWDLSLIRGVWTIAGWALAFHMLDPTITRMSRRTTDWLLGKERA